MLSLVPSAHERHAYHAYVTGRLVLRPREGVAGGVARNFQDGATGLRSEYAGGNSTVSTISGSGSSSGVPGLLGPASWCCQTTRTRLELDGAGEDLPDSVPAVTATRLEMIVLSALAEEDSIALSDASLATRECSVVGSDGSGKSEREPTPDETREPSGLANCDDAVKLDGPGSVPSSTDMAAGIRGSCVVRAVFAGRNFSPSYNED